MAERKEPALPNQPDKGPKLNEPVLPDLIGFSTEEYDPVKDLPNGRIKALISALDSGEKESAAYSFKEFEEWSKNPKKARVEWLLSLYQKKGWITGEEFVELKTMPPDETYENLRKRCLERADLPELNSRIVIQANSGENIASILEQNGLANNNRLAVRFCENNLIANRPIVGGNDRDHTSISHIQHHSGADGEELAMIRTGVTADQTVYVTRLTPDQNIPPGKSSILIYSTDALEAVGPNGYPRTNGFSVFHFIEDAIMQRSLVAIIHAT